MFTLIQAWDTALLTGVRGFENYNGSLIGIGIAEFGNVPALIGVGGIGLVLLARARRWRDMFGLAVAAGGAEGAALCLKLLTHRPRPPLELASYLEAGSSFPSAHAAVAIGLYGFLAWLVWRDCTERRWWHWTAIIIAVLLVLLIGASRIYLGVHYPSDILAGYAIGGLFLFLGIKVTRRWGGKNLC